MLTALIAEDELLVKIGISSCVPWAELNVAVVGEASDGMEAWELFQKYRPDIIILDLLMPGLNGIELLQRIRAVDRHCAVIVVTNVDEEGLLEEVHSITTDETSDESAEEAGTRRASQSTADETDSQTRAVSNGHGDVAGKDRQHHAEGLFADLLEESGDEGARAVDTSTSVAHVEQERESGQDAAADDEGQHVADAVHEVLVDLGAHRLGLG